VDVFGFQGLALVQHLWPDGPYSRCYCVVRCAVFLCSKGFRMGVCKRANDTDVSTVQFSGLACIFCVADAGCPLL
jgi:hypothetical protein